MKKHQNLAQRLVSANTILSNILNSQEILSVVSENGFSREQLEETLRQLEHIRELESIRQVEYGEQHQVSEEFDRALADFYKQYMRTLKIARLAFNGHTEIRVALLLDGNREQTFSGLYKQADAFYKNLINNQHYQQPVARFNITSERLLRERELLLSLSEINNRQQKERGEAIDATRNRDAKVEIFDKFMGELTKICKIVFDDQPNTLKIIGVNA